MRLPDQEADMTELRKLTPHQAIPEEQSRRDARQRQRLRTFLPELIQLERLLAEAPESVSVRVPQRVTLADLTLPIYRIDLGAERRDRPRSRTRIAIGVEDNGYACLAQTANTGHRARDRRRYTRAPAFPLAPFCGIETLAAERLPIFVTGVEQDRLVDIENGRQRLLYAIVGCAGRRADAALVAGQPHRD